MAKSDRSSPSGAKQASSRKARSGEAEKRAGHSAQEESVLSGRMMLAFVLAVAMVLIPVSPLGRVIAKEAPRSEPRDKWQVGQTATVHLTVTTADFDNLACADPRTVEGAHCEYQTDTERFDLSDGPADDNRLHTLQPYRTTDSQLLLLAGLWAQPEVAMRLHNEPPRGVAESKLARFVAACRVRFVAEWENPKIRWKRSDRWSQQGRAMVASPLSCELLEEQPR